MLIESFSISLGSVSSITLFEKIEIPQKDISKEIYEQLILGKRIETTWEKIEEGSFVFFNFKNQYMSLVQYTKNIFTIIRNDVL